MFLQKWFVSLIEFNWVYVPLRFNHPHYWGSSEVQSMGGGIVILAWLDDQSLHESSACRTEMCQVCQGFRSMELRWCFCSLPVLRAPDVQTVNKTVNKRPWQCLTDLIHCLRHHGIKGSKRLMDVLRTLDYVAIYFLIPGTMMPAGIPSFDRWEMQCEYCPQICWVGCVGGYSKEACPLNLFNPTIVDIDNMVVVAVSSKKLS